MPRFKTDTSRIKIQRGTYSFVKCVMLYSSLTHTHTHTHTNTNKHTQTHKTHVRDAEAERFATPTFDRSAGTENGQNATNLGHIL